MRRSTSVDVAREAGVSQSTVSRALAGDGRISEETKKKIRKTAERLGYTPNGIARSLQTKKTNMVGLIMADILNPFYPAVLEIYTQKLNALGKQLLLLSVPKGFEVDDVLPSMLQYEIDGLIVTSAVLSSRMRDILHNRNTRVVLFNRSVDDFSINSVCCENRSASMEVAALLVAAGHRRIALIGGRPDTSTHRERCAGFQDELRRHGLEIIGEKFGENTYGGGYRAAIDLLSGPTPPDAIFCIADVMALGALDAARFGLGLKVPRDVSIVGFDDIPSAAWPAYDLTTFRQPIEAMVGRSLSLLFDPADFPPAAIRIPGELIIRGSTNIGAATA
ncbi:LacI family DNA-binding transcriptional regulator [Mesorhizobium sp. CO1-1-4]|uniref:LacI family DNA-binding transcriptional regulator n=1 Tax=Mesorhizobium sp. CO1-1-4 TaxID=2876633 RepID=UPI001CCAE939|nr:LacI family DNA-binding transcriptional regulator [Mesorhizobium sp. CO1-1-4]MBZ9738742.1 LacI family DNA-binding transcriptional regulator [Mesorhizobium sp. CO1-1-4]